MADIPNRDIRHVYRRASPGLLKMYSRCIDDTVLSRYRCMRSNYFASSVSLGLIIASS